MQLLRFVVPALFATAFLAPNGAYAQEFNCSVSVNYSQLSGSDFTFLGDLQLDIDEYMNKQRWTEDTFQENERIECAIQVLFQESISLTSFQARLIVVSRRPTYNTTHSSVVVQFNDDNFQFNYAQGQPLVFNLEQYDPLSSVLDFYAYVMLGYDYDTFSVLGGTRYFEIARRVAERASSQSAPGWSQVGSDRGRMNLVTQILDPRFRPLRKAYFDYHFNGLDRFVSETDAARNSVLEVLQSLEVLFDDVARQYALDLFFSAKYTELASIFEQSPRGAEAYDLLTQLDPSHTSDYQRLVQ